MERRYQVFVSSTYADLAEERAEVIKALLELDCIPSGMELFPATNEAAWELIKSVIDDSDYYCLVIGGRYGSVDPEGVSYTEKEYDYAISQKKPVIAFFHGEPSMIPSGKTESSELGRVKLEAFRSKVERAHHRKPWTTGAELGGLVSRSLIMLRKHHPAEGWVQGRFAATDALLLELAELRTRVAELQTLAAKQKNRTDPKALEMIAGGTDEFGWTISYSEVGKKGRVEIAITTTWDNILKYVGPALINECSDNIFESKLNLCFYHCIEEQTGQKVEHNSIVLPYMMLDQIKIQLRALGQMVPGTKRRPVASKDNYWKLTESGETRLIGVQALPKPIKQFPPGLGLINRMMATTLSAPEVHGPVPTGNALPPDMPSP